MKVRVSLGESPHSELCFSQNIKALNTFLFILSVSELTLTSSHSSYLGHLSSALIDCLRFVSLLL